MPGRSFARKECSQQMKYLKYGLYVLVGLILVTGILFGYIAATFDPNLYKSDITSVVAEKTGRTLSIEGDIGLTFFPKIGVRLGAVRLSERSSKAEFAGVDDLHVALAFHSCRCLPARLSSMKLCSTVYTSW